MCCDKRDTLKWGRNRDDCANLQAIFSRFTMDLLFFNDEFFWNGEEYENLLKNSC